MTTTTQAETIETLRRFIEHAPASAATHPNLVGWWTPDNVYVCASCAGRIMARGCNLPQHSTPVWKDQNRVPGDCCCCDTKGVSQHDIDFADDDGGICHATRQPHAPDWATLNLSSDGGQWYVDVNCKDCGRSGCVGSAEMLTGSIDW